MSNPILKEAVFTKNLGNDSLELGHVMTTQGTLFKTCVLGIFFALTFSYTWYLQLAGFADKVNMLTTVGLFGGLIMALIVSFGPKNNFLPFTTSLYAMFEGLLLGSVSAIANKIFPGVVPQAVLGTIFAVFGIFMLYSSKIVKCTDTFRKVLYISTFSVFGIYMTQLILNFFHITIPGIFSASPVGIIFSVIVVAIAAFNLVLDFDFIDRFSGKAPKYYEWFGGFSLMVTIVWLYIEILNLLMKLNSRN